MLEKYLKKLTNSFRWNGILPFFINPEAKDPFNPTVEEAVKNAPDPKTNWDRMALGEKSPLGVKNWVLMLVLLVGLASGLLERCELDTSWEGNASPVSTAPEPSNVEEYGN